MKVAVKLPNDIKGKIDSFPFIYRLVEVLKAKVEDEELFKLHLISTDDSLDILNLLPIKAYYHVVKASEAGNAITMHRACVNMRLSKPDLYFSLTESFTDATVGKSLGAKKSVGFAVGKNKFFLKEKVHFLQGRHKTEQIFELLRPFADNFSEIEIPNIAARDLLLEKEFAWSPGEYSIVDFRTESIEEWAEFFDLFVGKKFVLIFDEEQDIDLPEFSDKNEYRFTKMDSLINMSKLLANSITLISSDPDLCYLCSFCVSHSFYINAKGERLEPIYLEGKIKEFKEDENMSPLWDEVYAFIEEANG